MSTRPKPVLLGMDGGGTVTTTWIADAEGRILGRGHSGPSNIKAVGAKSAMTELDFSVLSAFRDANLEPCPIEVSCLGLAGFDRPRDKDWLQHWASETVWARRLLLVNDGDLVVAAGTPDGWGVGVIAGTGSIAVARGRDGSKGRAGGWGYLFGDEGSGYAVAIAGLRRVARLADGRDPRRSPDSDPLTRLICNALGIATTDELIAVIYEERFNRAKIARLAIQVVAAHAEDPSLFADILEPAGADLARTVHAAARSVDIPPGPLPLAIAGSFLLSCAPVSNVMINRLNELGYNVQPTPVPNPVEGALVLARHELEIS
ncbi:MAG: BadF/BadG/BcrA/BcrD ATPase family protein [Isosphaeraceae bacterium]|nr:BadF/BadG/BcrA/BcrD ATPase family protein [Isosphaeraceae bacterium]